MTKKIIKKDDIENLSFEKALFELNEIVEKLEEGQAQLEDAVDLFNRGMKLSSHCTMKLNNAKLQIEKLVENKDE